MHLDRYLCILSAGGSVGRIGGVVRSSLSIERFAIIHSLRQRGGFTDLFVVISYKLGFSHSYLHSNNFSVLLSYYFTF